MFRDPAPDPVERLRLLFPSNDLVAENCRGMKIGRIRSLLNIYGAFCIVDHKPRSLSAAQLGMLKDMARLIEEEFKPGAAEKAG